MFLLVGLGNPGLKYQYTKHNFGFLLADQIVQNYQLLIVGNKFGGQVFSGAIDGNKVLLINPQEYMNNSGDAVLSAASFHKILPEKIIVLHDDLDLALGRVKAKIGGGHAGHNGLRDIDDKIGKDYIRIRLGIGRPENKEYEIADYVLSKFSGEELKIVAEVNKKICSLLPLALKGRLDEFMNQFANPQIPATACQTPQ
ncbi:MAG: peptidyl-tRNA hydrolase [Rickettsiaceae bacterium]|jgi:PTH1 family peptidyl-tRNA hydrolase|nr:peptidyl-tRNA hydrolase [Rickettsiaceae bacterium]